jgi:hypothetical protein
MRGATILPHGEFEYVTHCTARKVCCADIAVPTQAGTGQCKTGYRRIILSKVACAMVNFDECRPCVGEKLK